MNHPVNLWSNSNIGGGLSDESFAKYTKRLPGEETSRMIKIDEKYLGELNFEFFNASYPEDSKEIDDFDICRNILPEHIAGNLDQAAIVILGLNPKYDEKLPKMFFDDTRDGYGEIVFNGLSDKEEATIPVSVLENEDDYWEKKLGNWKDFFKDNDNEAEDNYKKMLKRVAMIEYFPYLTKKYSGKFDMPLKDYPKYKEVKSDLSADEEIKSNPKELEFYKKYIKKGYLPGQIYGFLRLKAVIKKEDPPLIIISRSARKWIEAVPELLTTENLKVYEIIYQNANLTLDNLFRIDRTSICSDMKECINKIGLSDVSIPTITNTWAEISSEGKNTD